MVAFERPRRCPRIDLANSAPAQLEYFQGRRLVTPRPPGSRPCLATELPADLWDKPALIDFDYWAEVRYTLRQQGVILPCDLETDDLDGFEFRGRADVPEEIIFGHTGHGDNESNSVLEMTRTAEDSCDERSELLSLGAERPTYGQIFGVPSLLRHLGQRVLGFITLLAAGRA